MTVKRLNFLLRMIIFDENFPFKFIHFFKSNEKIEISDMENVYSITLRSSCERIHNVIFHN